MKKQKWTVTIENREISVEYKCSLITGKTMLTVDGDSFVVKGKPFGIGMVRRESIMLGGSQGILDVGRGGRARLIVRDGEVKEA